MWGCCIRDDSARAELVESVPFDEEVEPRVAVVINTEEPDSAPPPEQPKEIEEPQCVEEPKAAPPPEQPKEIEEPQCVEEPKAAPPLQEPALPSSRKVIVFTTPGSEDVMVTFTKAPIGITFSNQLPIKVDKVKGHAEELGVQPGWVFKSIDGSPVEGKDFRTVKAELVALGQSVQDPSYAEAPKSLMPSEEPAALSSKNVVVFTTPGGEDVTVTFTKAPIGITFNDKELPLKTDKVKGHAEELGVQPGWLFKSVGGSPVEGKDFRTVKAELVAISQSLNA